MDFRKTYFLLPNLFTLASVFCGFYAVSLCARLGEEGVADSEMLYKAALAIIFGGFFDATDGRIARLTKTQSELGIQLDSLADVITFGVAPGLLIYRWGLEGLGRAGLFVAFLFVACGALRLARFNVLAMRDSAGKDKDAPKKVDKYMLGLPIPVAAACLVALVLANRAIGLEKTTSLVLCAALVVVLSALMISRVHFRSMKDLKMNRRTLAFTGVLATMAIVVAARFNNSSVLIFLIVCYIALGLAEELRFLHQRRVAARAERARAGEQVSDAVVLAELGVEK